MELINDDEYENQLNDTSDLNEEDVDDSHEQKSYDHENADIDNIDHKKENVIKCNACSRELTSMAKVQGCDWETAKSKFALLQKNKTEKFI